VVLKLSWSDVTTLLRRIAGDVQGLADVVVGVGRSGLVPAALLCNYAGCRALLSVFAKKYGEGKPPRRLYEKPVITWGFSGDLGGASVLVVDDIAVTGETLRVVGEYVKTRGAGRVYTCVVVRKPGASVDFYGLETEECVVFPWES